jgi:predicted esterase
MPPTEFQNHTLAIERTARYYTLEPADEVREVWFVLHGYGQLASYFLRHFRAIDDGHRLIVAPEALSRFYLQDHQRVGASWMTREAREAEIDDYLRYLDALYDRIFASLDRDAVTVHLLGFSQGGATASRWAMQGQIQPDRLLLWAGDLAHDIDLAACGERLGDMNLTFIVGSKDEFITPDHLAAQEARLSKHHIPYRFIPFDGEHRLDAAVLKALADG